MQATLMAYSARLRPAMRRKRDTLRPGGTDVCMWAGMRGGIEKVGVGERSP